MTTLLRYDLTTDPFPLQASPSSGPAAAARLTVVASNPNADPAKNPVTLEGISVTIPVGSNSTDLSADVSKLGPVAPEDWTLKEAKPAAGAVTYSFAPLAGKGAVGKKGLVFVFNNITPNTQSGVCQLTLKEGKDGKLAGQGLLSVTKFPAGWGRVSFWLDPADVPFGGATTLHWSGPAGATYVIQYAQGDRVVSVPAQGEPALGPSGQYPAQAGPPLTLDRTTVFTLGVTETIAGQTYRGQEQKTAVVRVPPPRILKFEASPMWLKETGETAVTLSWKTENVSNLLIEKTPFEGQPEGSHVVKCSEQRTFLATAYGMPDSGQPAFANAYVGSTNSTGFLPVWGSTTEGTWAFKPKGVNTLLKLNLNITETHESGPVGIEITYRHHRISLAAPDGALVADFGKVSGNVRPQDVSKATFGQTAPPVSVWYGVSRTVGGQGDYERTYRANPENAGATWGVKFSDGTVALIWFAEARPRTQTDDRQFSDWSFTFGWLDCSQLRGPQTQTEDQGGETV